METFKTKIFTLYYKYTHKYAINANNKNVLATVYIIFTLLTISILTFFAIRPALTTVSGLQQQLLQNQDIEQQMKTKLVALNNLDNQYQTLTPDLPSIFLAIPRSPEIPYLSRQLENIARTENLSLSHLTFDTLELYPAEKNNQPLFSFTFSITVSGQQSGITQFIGDLINFDRIISIDRISSGIANGSTNYESTIIGRAYYYNQ